MLGDPRAHVGHAALCVFPVEGEEPVVWREHGAHRGTARGHLPGGRGLPWDLGHHGGPARPAAAEIFSKWWRNFIPLKFLWHLGFCFSFFPLHPPRTKSTRAFADSAAVVRHPGAVPPPRAARPGAPRRPFSRPAPREVSGGVGQVGSFKRSFYFMVLVFNFSQCAHIKESVFKNKNRP